MECAGSISWLGQGESSLVRAHWWERPWLGWHSRRTDAQTGMQGGPSREMRLPGGQALVLRLVSEVQGLEGARN